MATRATGEVDFCEGDGITFDTPFELADPVNLAMPKEGLPAEA